MLTDELIVDLWSPGSSRPVLGKNKVVNFARAIEAEVRKEQASKIAELSDALQFVERWAVHHGSKESTSAESALSVIQHYPPIAAITASYADGKTPDTFNPFTKIAELERQLEAARKDSERLHKFLSGDALTVKMKKSTVVYGPNNEPEFREAFISAIDAAIKKDQP